MITGTSLPNKKWERRVGKRLGPLGKSCLRSASGFGLAIRPIIFTCLFRRPRGSRCKNAPYAASVQENFELSDYRGDCLGCNCLFEDFSSVRGRVEFPVVMLPRIGSSARMTRKSCPTDHTDLKCDNIEHSFHYRKLGWLSRRYENREFFNDHPKVYIRQRPRLADGAARSPLWESLYGYNRRWRMDGAWQRVHGILQRTLLELEGCEAQRRAAVLNNQ